MPGRWLDFITGVIKAFASRLQRSRWLALTALAALSFSLFYAFQVLLEIHSMHPVIVFLPIAGAAAH